MATLATWARAYRTYLAKGTRGVGHLGAHPSWLLAAVLVSAGLLLWPVPALFVDVLLALNLVLAVVLCSLAARAGEPLRLPALPVLLLVSVLLRLGANVAALRLILSRGAAGFLIRKGGELLVGGDLLVGGVLIIAIGAVLYLVLSRGSERVAEVAARFVLDALPGRQAAIEADLRSGAIDQTQAQERRAALDREAQIYGALDGALRLLKGDVVAALLLLFTGLLGGILVGTLRSGLAPFEALEHYGLLVIGQGLFAQVPALLNTAAAGLVLMRGGLPQEQTARQGAFGQGLQVDAGAALGLEQNALQALRESLCARLGVPLPAFELARSSPLLPGRRLSVRLYGAQLYAGNLPSDVDGISMLAEVLLAAAADLFPLDAMQDSLDALAQKHPALVRETVPRRIDLGRLAALLRRLLVQRVWPLDLRAILETIATLPKLESDLEALTEQVRGGLGRFLIAGLLRGPSDTLGGTNGGPDGLPALLLSIEIEELLREAQHGRPAREINGSLAIEPELARDIVKGVLAAKKLAPEAALLCHADVRRSVEQLLLGTPSALPVLAYSEVPPSVPLVVRGRVEPGLEAPAFPKTDRAQAFVDSAAVPWQMRPISTGR